MVLTEDIKEHEDRLKRLEEEKKKKELKAAKKMRVKIPRFIKKKPKDTISLGVLVLGANRHAKFEKGTYKDGLIYVGDKAYKYEKGGVYHIKKSPFVVLYEWRTLPVGGIAEEYKSRVLDGEDDEAVATELNITNYGQQTIVRAIEQSQVDDMKGKMKGLAPIAWLFIGVGAIYVISKLFGG